MTEAIQPFGLLISAVVATAVIIATIRVTRDASSLRRFEVVLIGGGLTWLMCSLLFLAWGPQYAFLFFDLTKSPIERLYWWVVSGVFWLLLLYVLRRVRLNSLGRRIIAVIAVQYGWAGLVVAAAVIWERLFAIATPFSWLPSVPTLQEQFRSRF
jgi:hypothetical protein